MGRQWWSRFAFLIFCVGLSIFYVYPTLAGLDLEKTKYPFKQKINFGLDLKGGLYLVYSLDFNEVFREMIERRSVNLEATLKENGTVLKKRYMDESAPDDDPKFFVEFNPSQREKIYNTIKEQYTGLRITVDQPGKLEMGLVPSYKRDQRDKLVEQSKAVIQNRIDEFGLTEPTIATQGNDRIVVEIPGTQDLERAKRLVGKTAKLEFKLVDETKNFAEVTTLVSDIEKEHKLEYKKGDSFEDYVKNLNKLGESKIPANDEISFERELSPSGEIINRVPYLLKSKVEVPGEDLDDAFVSADQTSNRPVVAFRLNPRGAAAMEAASAPNVGKRLAIVLDGIVVSAPELQSRIGANGQITLGGNYDQASKEARDLSIVLRAGALPAKLSLSEQRVVGPTLGADSIKKGAFAGIVGALIVYLFIMFYYRVSGVIAVVSLVLNVLFVLAILVGLEAVLTLPGIAGIALTVGIAVDSNVVIYERIREEIRAGKSVHGAVEAGFQKALRTILDANVTNAAAATVLYMYGTGPIKGFAVTMIIGIVTTLFTAVFVCRLLFGAYLARVERRPNPSLSI